MVGLDTKPNKTQIRAEKINRYLEVEGQADDAEQQRRLKEEGVGGAERYAKFAKAIVQVRG